MYKNLLKRNFFNDLTLRTKLVVSIILCIILPIFILSISIGQNLSNEYRNNAYENQLRLMERSIEDIDLLYKKVWDLKITFQVNFDIQKIVKGSAEARDYYQAATKISDLTQSLDYIHSITLSTEREIIFQQDKFLSYIQPEFFQKATETGNNGFWTNTYKLENAFFDKDKGLYVLSFFYLFHPGRETGTIPTLLGITILEEALAGLVVDQFENVGAINMLMRGDGLVLSSHDKKVINTYRADLLDSFPGQEGVIEKNGSNVVFYVKSQQEDLILLSVIPRKVFFSGQTTIALTIGLAIVLSFLFGIVFSLIQNRYIIKPLNELLFDMDKVKVGDFSITEKTHNKDEIGHITLRFEEMTATLKHTIDEVYLSKIHEQESRFTALVSQINPHFLYNTLDSIHWLAIKHKDYTVGEQIETLADVFRHVLSDGREFVKVREELKFVTDYMFLMNARYGDRINLEVYAQEEFQELLIPKLIIQPLVENAIIHGLEDKLEGGWVRIAFEKEGADVIITVADNGHGATEEVLRNALAEGDEIISAFALRNINSRLKLCYGETFGLQLQSVLNQGFLVQIRIPLHKVDLS